MRRRRVFLVTLLLLAVLTFGCFNNLAVSPRTGETVPGKPVQFTAVHSVGCDRDQATDVTTGTKWFVDGKPVPSGLIAMDKPGTYEISAEYAAGPGEGKGIGDATLVVTGSSETTKADEGIAFSKDEPEPADPATLERIFLCGNDASVDNGGTPPKFTTTKPWRVREIWTYHWNYGKGTSGGGTITLKSADGSTVGEWSRVRTAAGQGGVPNAYWIADTDLQLPAGTYTIYDSDPATWAQNSMTAGVGNAWVMAQKP